MTDLVLMFASFVLGLAWGRIRGQRREIDYWRNGSERLLDEYRRQVSVAFISKHLQTVHDEMVIEIPDKKSWDDIPELKEGDDVN